MLKNFQSSINFTSSTMFQNLSQHEIPDTTFDLRRHNVEALCAMKMGEKDLQVLSFREHMDYLRLLSQR